MQKKSRKVSNYPNDFSHLSEEKNICPNSRNLLLDFLPLHKKRQKTNYLLLNLC